ncbi:MAG: Rho termination factor N-terminal domain-containing protein [Cyanobacteria bacterium P01_A01_bin.37]
MSNLSDTGKLMHLYVEDIDPGSGTDSPEFLIQASAHLLNQKSGRNWVPVIVRETGEDAYEVIGNSFIFAVAEEAGLEKVWCIIAEDTDDATEITKVLTGEITPKINLSKASRDEIKSALQYVIEQPGSALKSVQLGKALPRIDEAPRQYWNSLNPITQLKCGITRGKKLKALEDIFYLTPEPMPDIITDSKILNTMTTTDLKKMAKKKELSGYSKLKKAELVSLLSE